MYQSFNLVESIIQNLIWKLPIFCSNFQNILFPTNLFFFPKFLSKDEEFSPYLCKCSSFRGTRASSFRTYTFLRLAKVVRTLPGRKPIQVETRRSSSSMSTRLGRQVWFGKNESINVVIPFHILQRFSYELILMIFPFVFSSSPVLVTGKWNPSPRKWRVNSAKVRGIAAEFYWLNREWGWSLYILLQW